MTTHSSILAQRTAWTEEPGGLQSMGSKRVRQDRSNLVLVRLNHNNEHNYLLSPETYESS